MITDVSETVTVTTIRPGRNVNYMSPVWTQMQAVNDLEGGDGCWLFPAEVAANTTTLQAFLHHGDHLLISEAAFHGTKTVCENFLKSNGVKVDTIPWDATDLTKWINPETKAVFVESPGSVTLEVMDLPSICESAHDHGVLVIADNTYGSGWLYCPLQLGCDVSIIAGTEYLSGHADVMMGATTARGEAAKPLRKAVRRQRPIAGAGRGLRDATRHAYAEPAYERHQENALQVVRWLDDRDEVVRVLHPDSPEHTGSGSATLLVRMVLSPWFSKTTSMSPASWTD